MERWQPGQAQQGLDTAEPTRRGPESAARPELDLEPFEVFYRRELPLLLILAQALVGPEYAEDVAQETLLVAYRRWRTIGVMRSPGGYVRGICLHKAVTVARRRTLERHLLGRFQARTSNPSDGLPNESSRLWDEVRALPRRQAQTVALHYALDVSVADIAEILDCAEGTVKVHLHRARNSLAASLSPTQEDRS
jgi:RNA polymerase sigma-70 factor (ECF subfamily)